MPHLRLASLPRQILLRATNHRKELRSNRFQMGSEPTVPTSTGIRVRCGGSEIMPWTGSGLTQPRNGPERLVDAVPRPSMLPCSARP
jgi:hypothetical protein